jgi:hypothetical protein
MDIYFLGCSTLQFSKSQSTFRRTTSPPPSGKKQSKIDINQSSDCYLLRAGFLFGLLFDPENGYVPPKRQFDLTGLHYLISQEGRTILN